MADRAEELVRWYLRLNGFFTVENFIVHAGDDPTRIRDGLVGNYTEADILAIRMPHSKEVAGALCIANDPALVEPLADVPDALIVEVKTGKDVSPNSPWSGPERQRIAEYVVRFFGFHKDEPSIASAAGQLLLRFRHEDQHARLRFVVVGPRISRAWAERGVSYVTFDGIADFLVRVRGASWLGAGIGVASAHDQWPPLIREVFALANDRSMSSDERRARIISHLGGTPPPATS